MRGGFKPPRLLIFYFHSHFVVAKAAVDKAIELAFKTPGVLADAARSFAGDIKAKCVKGQRRFLKVKRKGFGVFKIWVWQFVVHCSTFEDYLAAFFCVVPGGKGRGVVWLRADERVIAERSVAVVELRFSTVWLFG